MVEKIKAGVKHYLNPLHIYCRLRDCGLDKDSAVFVCRWYEKLFFRTVIIRKMT
jgi:hypothetical protein